MSHFSNHRLPRFLAVVACVCAWALAGPGLAAEPAEDATRRDDRFRKMVTNAKLSGHFTIDGDEEHAPPRHLQKEEYVITSASRLGTSDVWLLTSRIRYGKNDLTVPVPVTVKWAGDTPVMSLDKVGIPVTGLDLLYQGI